MQTAIPCSLMRGGTSKGLYFRASDLPEDDEIRDKVLLAVMGSPDARQIDGLGGAHPLTSKVAILRPSRESRSDIDYLFLQVAVDKAEVSDSQNCGNLLAAVGPFAIEEGMVEAKEGTTHVGIRMLNTNGLAMASVSTPGKRVEYEGNARIDGVPGSAAPILLEFLDIAGSSCGSLLPTGNRIDSIHGVDVTCIDNGMPVVILNALDFGLSGCEPPELLESDVRLKKKIESIRLKAGEMMNLGNVADKTVPKMCLVSPALDGGAINTRTFIPHRVHEAIGVLGAVSVATACLLSGTIGQQVSQLVPVNGVMQVSVEHPTGFFTVEIEVGGDEIEPVVRKAALLRTARLLMQGSVLIPAAVWEGKNGGTE